MGQVILQANTNNTFCVQPMLHKTEMVPTTFLFCPKCAARVETRHIPVGATIACEACGTEFVADVGGRCHEEAASVEASRDIELGPRVPSPRVLLAGVFGLPFCCDAAWRWLLLALGAAAVFAAARLALWCHVADNGQVDRWTRVLLWNGQLFSTVLGVFILVGWVAAAGAFGLNVLRETSNGVEQIRNWPRLLALEGWGEWMIVAAALLLAVAPGVLIGLLATHMPLPESFAPRSVASGIAVGLTAFLFPIFLLSMLEADARGWPFATVVWRSIPRDWIAWVEFHAIILAVAAADIAIWGLVRGRGWPIESLGLGVAVALAWMIYCRLLGRLAGYCSGRL